MLLIDKLKAIRTATGPSVTIGLSDQEIETFLERDKSLALAIESAFQEFESLDASFKELLKMDELSLVEHLQSDYVNFYDHNAINPYVSLSAKGPWVVTLHGAVVHDSGGYGMLGFGHGPEKIIKAMNANQVMANIMTANLSQKKLSQKLRQEIGHTRSGKPTFDKFLCLNSGSEAVTVAARISDAHASHMTDKGGHYEGRTIKWLALRGGFHGRTDRPAQASDSSLKVYKKLASFKSRDNLDIVEVNDVEALKARFANAEASNVFYEMLLMEPVMGEGNPGVGLSRAFYDEARSLTKKYGTLLLIDSIQAGLRAHGCLSITDYPGFSDCEAPDMETYSKAVNAGQYPLSILAMRQVAAELYKTGIYGNTMTSNPRALEVACAVLDTITPQLRENIVARGKEFLEKLEGLKSEFPKVIERITGTGLLFAIHLNPQGYTVLGEDCVEAYLRRQGIGVIHGGRNALRFTPHFMVSSSEVDLIVGKLRDALARGPVYR